MVRLHPYGISGWTFLCKSPAKLTFTIVMLLMMLCGNVNANPTKGLLENDKDRKPNVVLIFCDDLGYGDIEPFGAQHHLTPNLLRMAKDGIKLTDFYVSSGVCTPSRASLMTGSYPRRVDMHVNGTPPGKSNMRQVLFAVADKGLNPEEETIADLLKESGYATAMIGKWHLGRGASHPAWI
jgi:arylsulfatase A